MPGVSIHAWDVSRGIAAAGMRVELKGPDGRMLLDKAIDSRGVLEIAELPVAGLHEAVFHVGDWYRTQGVSLPKPAFLEAVPYRFGIADLKQHYHLPFKVTPWGFSLFRGGA